MKNVLLISLKYLSVVLLLLLQGHYGYSQTKISLQQAISYAIDHNLQLKTAAISEKISDQELRRAKLDKYPDLFARTSAQLNVGRSLDFTSYSYVNEATFLSSEDLILNITVFQGLQKTNQIKQNKYNLEANKSNTQRIKNDLILNVVALYLKLLLLKDQLTIAKQQDTLSIKQMDYIVKNFEMGKKLSVDVSRAKFQLAKAQMNITSIQNDLNNYNLELNEILNMPPKTELQLTEPSDTIIDKKYVELDDIYNNAVNTFPQITQMKYNKLSAIKEIDIAKGSFYPRLNLTGNITSNYSNRLKKGVISVNSPFFEQFKANLYQYVSLNLTIPIFNKLGTKISVNQAKLKLEEVEVKEEQVKNDLYKVISKAAGDLQSSRKTYRYNQEAFASAKETFNLVQQRYILGSSNSLDLTQAQNEMNKIQFELIQSKYDVIFRNKIIDFYLGRPISY